MEKITKIKNDEIKKDQLLSEGRFISYCNDANNRVVTMTGKLRKWIDEKLLMAMEYDGFLKPLLIIEESVRQTDGSQKMQPVHYYSPFQIYIASQLVHNIINDQGRLQSPDSIEWQNQQKTRFVSWGHGGGMSFNIEYNTKKDKGPSGWQNPLTICDYLYDFLRMLHSLDLADRYSDGWKHEQERYYTGSPNFQFNLDKMKTDKTKLLDQFSLTVDKLESLRVAIGHTALIIDPLEKWYPFLQRLPQWRKDELKGEALLAQDLYGLCEIIADVLEIVSGLRPQELLEKLRSNFPSPDNKRNEYARGTDIEAIKLAASKFKAWLVDEKNSRIVNEKSGNSVVGEYHKRLEEIEQQLEDYKKRYEKYGAGRSVNSGGFLHVTTQNSQNIAMTELDQKTKHIVDQTMDQLKAQSAIEDEATGLQEEIGHAIRWRLDDIQRDLTQLIYEITRPLDEERWKLDAEKQNGQQHTWWGEYMMSGEAPADSSQVQAYYFEKFQPKKVAEYDKKIKPILDASHSLASFAGLTRLVLCANCRKNTVLLHQAHNDQRVSSEAICDECIRKGEPQKIKGAEWCCRWCGKKIYTFAHGNILSDVLFNTSNATIQLDYGRITIRARCPNKDCKKWNDNHVDWGWLH